MNHLSTRWQNRMSGGEVWSEEGYLSRRRFIPKAMRFSLLCAAEHLLGGEKSSTWKIHEQIPEARLSLSCADFTSRYFCFSYILFIKLPRNYYPLGPLSITCIISHLILFMEFHMADKHARIVHCGRRFKCCATCKETMWSVDLEPLRFAGAGDWQHLLQKLLWKRRKIWFKIQLCN